MRMEKAGIVNLLIHNFPYSPTPQQEDLLKRLAEFIVKPESNKLFVLKGYAGTGKTTVVSSLVQVLPDLKLKFSLLAPTGRAAKVLASYTSKQAFTIHKAIYSTAGEESGYIINLRENTSKNTVFIVDESSMIGNETLDSSSMVPIGNLLEDLLTFVFQGDNNSLILIGDTAQLPPVGTELSHSLDVSYLSKNYGVNAESYELTEVLRQSEVSGILHNATRIRNKIVEERHDIRIFNLQSFTDIKKINGEELEELLNSAYSNSGFDETVFITRSNKRANQFNTEIRKRIFFREGEINAGDKIMIVKNNYFWLPKKSNAGFIANGDMAEIIRVRKFENLENEFFFADASIKLMDNDDEIILDVKLLLNTLTSDSASLSYSDYNKLAMLAADGDLLRFNRYEKLKFYHTNPYINALQIKFGYALTCHKTQGGQWEQVFVEQGYFTEDQLNLDYYKWLYTAVTRATKQLYLVNFNGKLFI